MTSAKDQNQEKETIFAWEQSYPDGLSWHEKIKTYPVYEMLDETVAKHGDRPAFNFMGRKSSWREIGILVDKMAKGLQEGHEIVGNKMENPSVRLWIEMAQILKEGF